MTTSATLKNFILNNDFVIVPREQYENLLREKATKHSGTIIKRSHSFKVPQKHEKFYEELDKELTESWREFKDGKASPIFNTAEEGIAYLKSRKIYRK